MHELNLVDVQKGIGRKMQSEDSHSHLQMESMVYWGNGAGKQH